MTAKNKHGLAEEYADSKGTRGSTYGKSAWWKPRRDAYLAGYESLEARLESAERLLKDFRDNWDCDSDAHKYGTPCRCCEARSHFEKWDKGGA